MNIKSPAFADGQEIPAKYTCDGENVSPPLEIESMPGGTKSLALIFDDPDAPGGTFDHWLVWNIPPLTSSLEEGAGRGAGDLPEGAVQGVTDFRSAGYGGPCPPNGRHRYRFHLFALDSMLDLREGSTRDDLERAMEGKILERASLMGTYDRRPGTAART